MQNPRTSTSPTSSRLNLKQVKTIKAGSSDPTVIALCDAIERLHSRLSERSRERKDVLVLVYGDGYSETYAEEGVSVRYLGLPRGTDVHDNWHLIDKLPLIHRNLVNCSSPVANFHAASCPNRQSLAFVSETVDAIRLLNELKGVPGKGNGAV